MMYKIPIALCVVLVLAAPISGIASEPSPETPRKTDWLGLIDGLKLEVDDGSWKLSYGDKPAARIEEAKSNRPMLGGLLFLGGLLVGVYAVGYYKLRKMSD